MNGGRVYCWRDLLRSVTGCPILPDGRSSLGEVAPLCDISVRKFAARGFPSSRPAVINPLRLLHLR